MKIITILLMVSVIPFSGYTQFDHKGIKIDGSVSYQELNDTLQWKTVIRNPNIIIRESDSRFYLAVMSNTYTSVNLYLPQKGAVKVPHVSYSLGDATYTKTNRGLMAVIDGILEEESGKQVYDWKFRDLIIRNDSAAIDLTKQMEIFYAVNRWVSHTMPMGSYREVEFILSKDLVFDSNQIYVTYLYKYSEGETRLSCYPNQVKSITGEANLDADFQNGYLPELKRFVFK